MVRLEARPQASPAMALVSPLLALALTVVMAAALFTLLGKNPWSGLGVYFFEPLNGRRQLTEVALKATPLILCALGLAVCYRSNVWNIGAEGQFLLGAITAGGVALWASTSGIKASPWVWTPVLMIAGAIGGMGWAAIVAYLRSLPAVRNTVAAPVYRLPTRHDTKRLPKPTAVSPRAR